MKKLHGYTLVEMLVCLSIGGILLGIALPSFTATLHRSRQAEATNLLLGALHYARGAAVMGRQTVSLCAGHTQCERHRIWQQNLLVFGDSNNNGLLDQGETLLRQIPTPAGSTWMWSNFRNLHYLQFEGDGTPRALNGTLTLCQESQPTLQIKINVTGRARTQSPAKDASCG